MTTLSIAFLSKAGIVVASDSDYSIRQLSKAFPGVVVVDTHSTIPWKTIIDDYLFENDSRLFPTLDDACDSFVKYFKERKIMGQKPKKESHEYLLFLGFNENDIYPSIREACVEHQEKHELELSVYSGKTVYHDEPAFFNPVGDFNFVSPILYGASDRFLDFVENLETKLLSSYKAKMVDKMNAISMDRKWIDSVDGFDAELAVDEQLLESASSVSYAVSVGLDTLSIQEMVDYAETLVNAEIRLRNLKHKERGNSSGTREIATITIPEGLTWIKHHLFAI